MSKDDQTQLTQVMFDGTAIYVYLGAHSIMH